MEMASEGISDFGIVPPPVRAVVSDTANWSRISEGMCSMMASARCRSEEMSLPMKSKAGTLLVVLLDLVSR